VAFSAASGCNEAPKKEGGGVLHLV
jgi:hypothetical protein